MTAVELFPCSGGMGEGFRRAGIVFEWAFDVAKDHCDSYEKNLGHRPVQMDVRDLLRMARGGWRPSEQLDLLVADPPCTPWSRAGKRKGVEDPRDMLGATCELIRLLRPRAYLIGNVPGLDDATQWHHVQRALDAADFGVPQHRIRPFWFGHLSGPCIAWPLPTHGQPSSNAQLPGTELKSWVTCRDALKHLPIEQLGRPVRLRWREPDSGFAASQGSCSNCASRSATITTRSTIPPPGHHPETGSILSQPNAVVLSELAATILQGFPESWCFSGKTKTVRWSQLGQAMPPPLAEAVARSVARQLSRTPNRPGGSLHENAGLEARFLDRRKGGAGQRRSEAAVSGPVESR